LCQSSRGRKSKLANHRYTSCAGGVQELTGVDFNVRCRFDDVAAYMITTVMSGATGAALGSLIGAAVGWWQARAPRYARRPVHSSEPSSLYSHRRRGTR
jgi:hypothetical protein